MHSALPGFHVWMNSLCFTGALACHSHLAPCLSRGPSRRRVPLICAPAAHGAPGSDTSVLQLCLVVVSWAVSLLMARTVPFIVIQVSRLVLGWHLAKILLMWNEESSQPFQWNGAKLYLECSSLVNAIMAVRCLPAQRGSEHRLPGLEPCCLTILCDTVQITESPCASASPARNRNRSRVYLPEILGERNQILCIKRLENAGQSDGSQVIINIIIMIIMW